MSQQYDAIVIGAGHNGLICAAYMAKAGKKVLVLERRHVVGGAAVSEEVFPGFTFSVLSYVVSLFRPSIIRDLELPRFGYEILPLETAYTPQIDGPGLCRWPDAGESRREISRFSTKDADVYPEFSLAMTQAGRFARSFIDSPAPDPTSLRPQELMNLLRMGQSIRGEDVSFLDLQSKLTELVKLLPNSRATDAKRVSQVLSGAEIAVSKHWQQCGLDHLKAETLLAVKRLNG